MSHTKPAETPVVLNTGDQEQPIEVKDNSDTTDTTEDKKTKQPTSNAPKPSKDDPSSNAPAPKLKLTHDPPDFLTISDIQIMHWLSKVERDVRKHLVDPHSNLMDAYHARVWLARLFNKSEILSNKERWAAAGDADRSAKERMMLLDVYLRMHRRSAPDYRLPEHAGSWPDGWWVEEADAE